MRTQGYIHPSSPYLELSRAIRDGGPSEIHTISGDDLERATRALRALEVPPNFGTAGELYVTHAPAVGQHRDSDALERSNFEVISEDLEDLYGETISEHAPECDDPDSYRCSCSPDVWIGRARHWLVGWSESVCVRPFARDDSGRWHVTDAWRSACEWLRGLERYPVADEEHYSDLEWSEMYDYLES